MFRAVKNSGLTFFGLRSSDLLEELDAAEAENAKLREMVMSHSTPQPGTVTSKGSEFRKGIRSPKWPKHFPG